MRGKKGAIYDQEKRDKLNIALQRLQQKVYIQDNSIWYFYFYFIKIL
jgi:hypothetical protein